ncbi:YicC family protein [soil metagenome]
MIRSMTGFGAADGEVGGQRVSVEIRSVNHRYFSPSIKLPAALSRWEAEVRDALRRGISRGHVTLSARFGRDELESPSALPIDETRFAAYVLQLRALQERYALQDSLDVATILRMPEVFVPAPPREELTAEAGEQIVAVVDRAVEALLVMRTGEGARLVQYLDERLAFIEGALGRIAQRAPARVTEQRDRLRTAVRDLTSGLAVDETRLAQEIALLADRLDVQEELSRFTAHIDAFRAALSADQSDGVGKRLGFLLQEMLREANTTGSKGNDAAIVADVLLIKEELERIREQVENVE